MAMQAQENAEDRWVFYSFESGKDEQVSLVIHDVPKRFVPEGMTHIGSLPVERNFPIQNGEENIRPDITSASSRKSEYDAVKWSDGYPLDTTFLFFEDKEHQMYILADDRFFQLNKEFISAEDLEALKNHLLEIKSGLNAGIETFEIKYGVSDVGNIIDLSSRRVLVRAKPWNAGLVMLNWSVQINLHSDKHLIYNIEKDQKEVLQDMSQIHKFIGGAGATRSDELGGVDVNRSSDLNLNQSETQDDLYKPRP